jgi:neurotransmitter:Na+ symporter, NSS family
MEEQQRGNWSSSIGFVLAATGSAIGLGNLWKFPYITWDNNGGAFVLVYLVCIAAVGLPIMMAELIIGRKTQKSAVPAMKEAVGPAWGLVGLWGVLCGFILLSYYTVIAGWSLFYFWKSVQWSLGGFTSAGTMGDLFGQQVSTTGLQLGLSLSFSVATVAVVYFGVQKGIERIARLFLPILFGILLLLLVSALGMDGSGQALAFLFKPNFAELEPSGVLEALGHAFFTLSLGMGAMVTYGSYLAKDQSIVKASAWIVALDTLIAIVASVIMFSVIFSVAGMSDQVGASPVGMLFISLPELFYTAVPFGRILGPLFYILVAFAALTSTMAMLEVTVAYVIDEHGVKRSKATIGSGALIFLFTIFAALSFGDTPFFSTWQIFDVGNPQKMGWFATMDHFVANWMLPTGGLAITIAAGWMMTREDTTAELVDGTEPGWFSYGAWRFFIRFVAPLAVAAIIIAVILGVDFA